MTGPRETKKRRKNGSNIIKLHAHIVSTFNTMCQCTVECGKGCNNRVSSYECNDKNCGLFKATRKRCNNRRISLLRKQNNWVKKGESKLTKGQSGLLAACDIPKGCFIVEYTGSILTQDRYDKIDSTKRSYIIEIGGRDCSAKYYIDASNPDNIARLVNSHCKPNCVMEQWIAEDAGRPMPCLVLVADRDIKKGEELYFDYRSSKGFPPDGCHCGSDNCWSGREPESPEVPPTLSHTRAGSGKKRKRVDEVCCTCQNPSYGNMIACDDETCSYEWFHWSCVGIEVAPAGRWICPVCRRLAGRRKQGKVMKTAARPIGRTEDVTYYGIVYKGNTINSSQGRLFSPMKLVNIDGRVYVKQTVLTQVDL